MPIGYMGAGLSRMADSAARKAEARENDVEPLAPGADPLAALDPETRELVTSLEPVVDPEQGTTIGDRIGGALVGAGIGGFIGALAANWTPRRQRWAGAGPMNVSATLTFAGIGAAIGGIAGFAKGHDPLQRDAKDAVRQVLPRPGSPLASVSAATHPAFASLHAS